MVSPFAKQIFACSGCISLYFMYGYMVGMQAVFLPILRKEGSEITLTAGQESWIPSSMIIIQIPAQMIGGIVADKLGRKSVVIMSMVPGLAACLFVYFATNYVMLIIAYCMAGWLFVGVMFSPIIVAESVSPKFRGAMLSVKLGFCTLGLAFTHVLGPMCYWRNLALYGLIPSSLGLIVLLITPESPAWLARKGRFEEAGKAFKWFRGDDEVDELNQLLKSQNKNAVNKVMINNKSKLEELVAYAFDRNFLKCMLIGIATFSYIEGTGKRLFVTFSSDIIVSIVHSKEKMSLYTLSFDIIVMLSYVFTAFYMHKIGRRYLMVLTGIPSILLIIIFSVITYLTDFGLLSESYSWLSMVLFIVNFLPLSLGVLPVLSTLTGEIMPLSHRGLGMCLLGLISTGISFVFTKYTHSMFQSIGVHGTYLVYAGISVCCLICIYVMSPETNLKTLIDVENEIKGEKEDTTNEGTEEMKELISKLVNHKDEMCDSIKCE